MHNYAPTQTDFDNAIKAVRTLKEFCRKWYTLYDTTDLDLLEDSLELDQDDCA